MHVCVMAFYMVQVTSSSCAIMYQKYVHVWYMNCTNRGHDYGAQTCFETVLNLRIDFISPLVDLI